jgi:hypothetical protein
VADGSADALAAITLTLSNMQSMTNQFSLNALAVLEGLPLDGSVADNVFAACVLARNEPVSYGFVVDTFGLVAPPSSGDDGGDAARRRLLAEEAAAASFEGYPVFSEAQEDYDLKGADSSRRARIAGARGNYVFGGLLLHQVRRTVSDLLQRVEECRASAHGGLAVACQEGVDKKATSTDLGGFGVDPSFNVRSILYNSEVAGEPSKFYNVSAGEANAFGVPYGFFHHPMAGLPDGAHGAH